MKKLFAKVLGITLAAVSLYSFASCNAKTITIGYTDFKTTASEHFSFTLQRVAFYKHPLSGTDNNFSTIR